MRTQGEWKVGLVPAGAATDARFWITADGKRIADVRDQPGGEQIDNAHLLAAAPKLRDALRLMRMMDKEMWTSADRAEWLALTGTNAVSYRIVHRIADEALAAAEGPR